MHGARIVLGCTALAIIVGLAACATPDVDVDALDAWREKASSAELPSDAVAAMSGTVTPSDGEPVQDDGVTVDLPDPAAVTTVEFSCFGDGTMSLSVTSSGPDSGAGFTTDPLLCGESPHDLGRVGIAGGVGITSITVSVSEADRESAWWVVVHGDDSEKG